MNKIIIDGYNLIHAVPDLAAEMAASLEQAREQLLRLLKSYCLSKRVQITVVFDGTLPPLGIDPPQPGKNLKVVFSRAPFKADPLIKKMVRDESKKKSLTVVSNDSDIRKYALGQLAKVLSTDEFYARLTKRSAKLRVEQKFDGEMSESELAEWKRLFGEE